MKDYLLVLGLVSIGCIGFTPNKEVKYVEKKEAFKLIDASLMKPYKDIKYNNHYMVFLEYQKMIEYVADRTGFTPAFIYSYLVFESFKDGEPSYLMQNNNVGAIKYKNEHPDYIYLADDCDGLCKFAKFETLEQGVEAWIDVLNQERYAGCKTAKGINVVKCMQTQGYHTSDTYRQRYQLMRLYDTFYRYRD